MNETPITLTLRIHANGDHLAGEVNDSTGRTVPFSGRIGLMCAIDACVTHHPDDPDRPCFGVTHQSMESA